MLQWKEHEISGRATLDTWPSYMVSVKELNSVLQTSVSSSIQLCNNVSHRAAVGIRSHLYGDSGSVGPRHIMVLKMATSIPDNWAPGIWHSTTFSGERLGSHMGICGSGLQLPTANAHQAATAYLGWGSSVHLSHSDSCGPGNRPPGKLLDWTKWGKSFWLKSQWARNGSDIFNLKKIHINQ